MKFAPTENSSSPIKRKAGLLDSTYTVQPSSHFENETLKFVDDLTISKRVLFASVMRPNVTQIVERSLEQRASGALFSWRSKTKKLDLLK